MEIHRKSNFIHQGAPLAEAQSLMLMVHGRGASAESILSLAQYFDAPHRAFIAPQATQSTWYPYPFIAPIAQNEPYLSDALALLKFWVDEAQAQGLRSDQIYLLGFSQGACLSLEFAARHPQAYAGIFGLSGGLIGPMGQLSNYTGDMHNTPVFLGCSDVDSHIPQKRVEESAEVFSRLGAQVTMQIYPNMGHTIIEPEITTIQKMM